LLKSKEAFKDARLCMEAVIWLALPLVTFSL
jgi:hypothetical protein